MRRNPTQPSGNACVGLYADGRESRSFVNVSEITPENITDLIFNNAEKILLTDAYDKELFHAADNVRRSVYSDAVYLRGLIEFTNYCKNNCFYCGIRKGNECLKRFRLSREEILDCCRRGYDLGFRTFVLQGGEDDFFDDKMICDIVYAIRERYSDCAVTLSVGEKPYESYKAYFDAGASRYLLRHETADETHYKKLHPKSMSLENRKKCLFNLKDIGYQTGSGFMVGSPFQTTDNILSDLRFLKELQPEMIGIGPYITHPDTPFENFQNGSSAVTIRLVAILRLMFTHSLIPATTALGTIDPCGREKALKAGANVIMPNISPANSRNLYNLYENKKSADTDLEELKKNVADVGYRVVSCRGDAKTTEDIC